MSKSNKDSYIVYIVKHNDEIIYVGSGANGRHKHVNSGTSHVYELNKLHFQGENLVVEIAARGLNKEQSINKEKEIILLRRPRLNKVYLKGMNTGILNANLGRNIISLLKERFKELFGEKSFERYEDSIPEIIKMIGISHLREGVIIPGVRQSRKMLSESKSRTLYEKILYGVESETMKDWLSCVFEYQKEGVEIFLKIST